jgi:hypothetical protein
VVQAVMRAPGMLPWLHATIQKMAGEIDRKLGASAASDAIDINPVPSPGGVDKLTLFQGTSGFAEMYAVIGDAQEFLPTIRLTVARDPKNASKIQVLNVRFVNSKILDVFDFDFDVVLSGYSMSGLPIYGPMAKAGAQIQAAHGTIGGAGGMAFRNEYILDDQFVYPGLVLTVAK